MTHEKLESFGSWMQSDLSTSAGRVHGQALLAHQVEWNLGDNIGYMLDVRHGAWSTSKFDENCC
eukprot:c2998_g1_i1 orf=246-437(+)